MSLPEQKIFVSSAKRMNFNTGETLQMSQTFFTDQKWNTLKFIDKLYTDSHDEVTGMLNLFVLMYAVDTVIMAENEHDMQRNLTLLNDYRN